MNITDEQKKQAAEAVKDGLKEGITATRGKNLTWLERALWIAALVAASVIQSFLGTGCQYVTPEQVVQAVDLGHEVFHIVHPDRECIIIRVAEEGK